MSTVTSFFNTILGIVYLHSEDGRVTRCGFAGENVVLDIQPEHYNYAQQIREYLAGRLTEFDIPLKLTGTAFQQRVWQALRDIRYGRTTTYGQLAAAVGAGANPRNVGQANGANPLCLLIPCHPIIGKSGELTGYAWGIERKQKILEMEGAIIQRSLF